MWALTKGSVVVGFSLYTSTVTCLTNGLTGFKDGNAAQKQRAKSCPEKFLYSTTPETLQPGIVGGFYSRYSDAKLFLSTCYSSSGVAAKVGTHIHTHYTGTAFEAHVLLKNIRQCNCPDRTRRFVWLGGRSSPHCPGSWLLASSCNHCCYARLLSSCVNLIFRSHDHCDMAAEGNKRARSLTNFKQFIRTQYIRTPNSGWNYILRPKKCNA